jgi:ABC-2 type transport system permease protein
MISLIGAEIYKIRKQSKTLYALAAILIIEGFVIVSAYYQGAGIIDLLLDNLKDSFELKGDLLNGNLIIYLILNSLWFHIPLILMIIISGFLTSEYKDKTIETVMLQPVSKLNFILSKYVVSIAFTIFIVLLLAVSTFLVSYWIFGRGDLVVYLDGLNFFKSDDAFNRLILAFLSGINSMVFFSVVSLTLAVILKDATKTWIVSAIFLICSNLLLKIDFRNELLNELFFSKLTDSWQYFFYYKIPYTTIYFKNLLLFSYTILVLLIGVIIFRRRDIQG